VPDTHCEYVLRCAAAGKPVYEKPMALDHGQCMRMIDARRRAGVPLWVRAMVRSDPRATDRDARWAIVGERPGSGVEWDEDAVHRYLFE